MAVEALMLEIDGTVSTLGEAGDSHALKLKISLYNHFFLF